LSDVPEAKNKKEMLLSQEISQTLFHRCRNLQNLGITGNERRSKAIEALADYAIQNCKKINRLQIDSGFISNRYDEDVDTSRRDD
jgi:putative protein kinase ArgK-like GTPase of G3E family